MAARLAWSPGYEGDEVALGIALAFALHAIPVVAILLRVYFPSPQVDEQPLVSQPVIGANLLKLGKPLDPKQLPDRLVPVKRTAPQQKIVASREEPAHKNERPDAGPPPPNAEDSDIQKLIAKSDPFAEDAGKQRPEQGFSNGSDAGTETDPNKVHAGDAYAMALRNFLHDHWQIPTVISQGEVNKLCVQFQIAIDPRMRIWFVQQTAGRPSGNDLFDDSARSMLQKLADDHTPLPEPPPEIGANYRGQRLPVNLGDGCR
jgi:TonB C terminal